MPVCLSAAAVKKLDASRLEAAPKRCKTTTRFARVAPESWANNELPLRYFAAAPVASELLLLNQFDHPEMLPMFSLRLSSQARELLLPGRRDCAETAPMLLILRRAFDEGVTAA